MECPECKSSLREGAKFCDQCGTEITEAEKAPGVFPVALRTIEGYGIGLKLLGGTIQEWAKSLREGEKKKRKDD